MLSVRNVYLLQLLVVLGALVAETFCRASQKSLREGPTFREAQAIGSGCRAKPGEKDSDVTFHHVLPEAGGTVGVLKVKMERFSLKRPPGPFAANGRSAVKECAVRAIVDPPKGMRLRNASARFSLVLAKQGGTEIQAFSVLRVGPTAVGSRLLEISAEDTIKERKEFITLIPGINPNESMPNSRCEEPRILSLDFTFLGKLSTLGDAVSVSFAPGESADIILDFEPCG